MAKGIEIGIASETKAFKQGIDAGVIAPLEDAEQALKDLGDQKSLDNLENDLEAAQDASKKLARETKRTADDIEDEYRKAYAKLKSESKEGFGGASEAAQGFKEEALQNFAETASSFDGSLESMVDMAQSTLGGLATSIAGPIGIIAAGAGAAGGALVAAMMQSTEKAKQLVKDMYDDMLQSGLDFLSAEYVTNQLNDLFSNDERAGDLAAVKKAADELGMSVTDVGIAWVTSGEKRDEVNARATEQLDKLKTKLADLRDEAAKNPGDQAQGQVIHGYQLQADALQGILDKMSELDGTQRGATENVNLGREAVNKYQDSLTDAQKIAQGLVDTVGKVPKDLRTDIHVKAVGDFTELDAELRKPRRVSVDLVTRSGTRVPW